MPMPPSHGGLGGPAPEVVARLVDYIERSTDLVGVLDDRGNVLYLNYSARSRLGVPPGETRPLTTADLFPEAAFELYYEQIRPRLLHGGVWSGYVPIRSAQGQPLEMWATVVGDTRPGGEIQSLVISARDVTEWRHIRDELSRQSTHDSLTGLTSQALLMDHIETALARARRTGSLVALMCIDVDDLKAVNDSYGHQAGDAVLIEVARRLRDSVRAIDTVARVGGDEFVVLLDGVDDEDEVERLTTRVHARLESEAVAAGGAVVNVSASAGTVIARSGETASHLLGRADVAMYEMKGERRWMPAWKEDEVPRGERGVTSHDVAVAVTQRSIVPYYQPVVESATRSLVGYQVLARWLRDRREPLPAGEFVAAVDRSAVGFSLDLAILRHVAADLAERPDQPRVYAHVCPRFLIRPGVARFVHEVLARAGLETGRLALVLPEQLLATRARLVGDNLAELGEMGVRFVITVAPGATPAEPTTPDELFTELRLGLGWTQTLADRPDDVAAAIGFAHDRGLRAHATGVETPAQLERLTALGCDLVEGHLVGAATPSPNGAGTTASGPG
jgi:diguanylate cyclase (GGDEF)-like protein/PAS domain S-box-containing protein